MKMIMEDTYKWWRLNEVMQYVEEYLACGENSIKGGGGGEWRGRVSGRADSGGSLSQVSRGGPPCSYQGRGTIRCAFLSTTVAVTWRMGWRRERGSGETGGPGPYYAGLKTAVEGEGSCWMCNTMNHSSQLQAHNKYNNSYFL